MRILPTRFWLIETWTFEFWVHPLSWRFRWSLRGSKAGRKWCSMNDRAYRWISVGPFTICESHLS